MTFFKLAPLIVQVDESVVSPAKLLRSIRPKNSNWLLHGTRYGARILKENRLRLPASGIIGVFFTRSPEVAEHWALLPRDDTDGPRAILCFDRARLQSNYPLECAHDPLFGCNTTGKYDEMEGRSTMK